MLYSIHFNLSVSLFFSFTSFPVFYIFIYLYLFISALVILVLELQLISFQLVANATFLILV